MTTITQIIDVLTSNNDKTVFHKQTDTELFCMIPEMGYPFEVHITIKPSGRIVDACDDSSMTYENFDAWKAQQIGAAA